MKSRSQRHSNGRRMSRIAALSLAAVVGLGVAAPVAAVGAPTTAAPVGVAEPRPVAALDTASTRVKEIVQATDNHDGVKGWVYNKTSRTLLVIIGSKYADHESFFLRPGEDFTYACGETMDLQFQQSGADNAMVTAKDPAASTFQVWDWQNLEYRSMPENSFFEYDDTSHASHVELKRKPDGNRGILGENSRYTTDWANLDIVVTDAR